MRISIIIIGRNEGWKLTKCLQSVYDTIGANKLIDYEVIYVDSRSTDDSIDRARSFNKVRIIQLTGDINAAIARNVGAKEAKGDNLFFLDGDMELISDHFSFFYKKECGLVYPFLSGDWDNYYYTQDWMFINKDNGSCLITDVKRSTVGGLFLIEKQLWNDVGGMNVLYQRSQDIDLGLRLAKHGVLLLRKKELLVHHHMIAYLEKTRKWRLLFSGTDLYGRSLLYRKSVFNKYIWRRILRNDYSVLILVICIFISVIAQCTLTLLPFLFVLIPKTINKKEDYFTNFLFFFLRDILVLIGVFFFFPAKPKNISYKEIT